MRRCFLLVLICITIGVCLNGCVEQVNTSRNKDTVSDAEGSGESVSLTVLTEPISWGQTYQFIGKGKSSQILKNINGVIAYYQSEHPNVDIKLEVLPKTVGERNNAITNKRVALMAGDTPDIYLMPTASLDEICVSPEEKKDFEPLFRDVAQAQTNHWFYDISAYYDADVALCTDELQQTVMDAGRVGNSRYILPLGYSFDVVFANSDDLSAMDFDIEEISSGGLKLFDSLIGTGDSRWLPLYLQWASFPLNYLPELCDYDTETVTLQENDLSALLERMNQMYSAQVNYVMSIDQTQFGDWETYLLYSDTVPYNNDTTPTRIDSICQIMKYLPTAKAEDKELEMIPVTTADGELVADITYWGAVGASCKNVKVAYDFLRTFLLPQVQHEEELVGNKTYSTDFDLVSPGWPVRYKDYGQKLWEKTRVSIDNMENSKSGRKEKLLGITIEADDFTVLDYPISYARFPSGLDQELYEDTASLREGIVPHEEVEEISSKFIRNLKYHLAEG